MESYIKPNYCAFHTDRLLFIIIVEQYINLYDHLHYPYTDLPENLKDFRVSGLNKIRVWT